MSWIITWEALDNYVPTWCSWVHHNVCSDHRSCTDFHHGPCRSLLSNFGYVRLAPILSLSCSSKYAQTFSVAPLELVYNRAHIHIYICLFGIKLLISLFSDRYIHTWYYEIHRLSEEFQLVDWDNLLPGILRYTTHSARYNLVYENLHFCVN